MLVSGPIGAIATGSGLAARMRAIRSTARSGPRPSRGLQRVSPIPLSPWTSVARTTEPEQRAGGALGDRHVVARRSAWSSRSAFSVQWVTSALPPTVVTARRSSSGPGDGEADGERVVEARVAVDDQRQRMLDRPERRRPRRRGRAVEGRPGADVAALVAVARAHASAAPPCISPARTAGRRPRPANPPDDARDDDDRDQVRDAVEQLRRHVDAEDRQQRLRRAREPEHERRAEGADRMPGAEDHRREGDEALAGDHLHAEVAGDRQRQVRAREPEMSPARNSAR